jgi:hypothetical protein
MENEKVAVNGYGFELPRFGNGALKRQGFQQQTKGTRSRYPGLKDARRITTATGLRPRSPKRNPGGFVFQTLPQGSSPLLGRNPLELDEVET